MERAAFYFIPNTIPRFVVARPEGGLSVTQSSLFRDSSQFLLALPTSAAHQLQDVQAYLYCFDSRPFRSLSNGDYIATARVVPERVDGPFEALRGLALFGYTVLIADDLYALRDEFFRLGMHADCEAMQIGDGNEASIT